MHAVLFQFRPYPARRADYLDLVALLRPELLAIAGFLANERFVPAGDAEALVSLSLWQDEAAVLRWRAHAGHRVAQLWGRRAILASFRLRVGLAVAADAGGGLLQLAVGTGLTPLAGGELHLGLLDPARRLVLGPSAGEAERRLVLRVIRDYGGAAPAGA